jgi:DNA polymerase-3 subunit epsilon
MYAIIDLETTGGRPETDRIIEIAIYTHDGASVTGEYSSLVNPGVPIPPFISRLTGISEEMVAVAPTFSEICSEVRSVLGDHIFVAHNAPFDHSFLSHHFRIEGIEITNQVLCTCATARKVIPGHPSYSLGKLCRATGIRLENAHRAAADALATTRLLELLLEKSHRNLAPFLRDPNRLNPLCRIPEPEISSLSEKAGILYFTDEQGNILFLSKAWNIRKKAKALTSRFGTGKLTGLAAQAVRVTADITGSRIAASVMEQQLLESVQPVFNRKFRDGDSRMGIYDMPDENGYLRLEVKPAIVNQVPVVTFGSRVQAFRTLKTVCTEYSLESSLCGLSDTRNQLEEPAESYNYRAVNAMEHLGHQRRNFVITDHGPEPDSQWVIVVEDSFFKGMKLEDSVTNTDWHETLEELSCKNEDRPVIMRMIGRHIAKGEYLHIEPLALLK